MEENLKPGTQPLDIRESALWMLLLKQPDATSAQQAPPTWGPFIPHFRFQRTLDPPPLFHRENVPLFLGLILNVTF